MPTAPYRDFTYDALNRLATAQVGVNIAKSFSYNNIGNILTKSDVGTYSYPAPVRPRPHAVASISGVLRPSIFIPRGFLVSNAASGANATVITVHPLSLASACPGCGTRSERIIPTC